MDCLFEVVYVDTEEMLRQVHCKAMNKRRIFWAVLMSLCAVLFGFLGWSRGKPVYSFTAIAYVALGVWYFMMPYRSSRKQYENKRKYYDGTIPPTTIRFGEEIVIRDSDSVQTVPYKKLSALHVLKDCMCIVTETRAWYAFPVSGFTQGTPRELLDFLRKECPQLKLPDWQW